MLSRLAARLLTGPPGFFVAGVLDVTRAWSGWARHRLGMRLRARRTAR